MEKFKVISFYKFISLTNLENLKKKLLDYCQANDIKGKIYLANEGINASLFGELKNIDEFKKYFSSFSEFSNIIFKEDYTDKIAFQNIYVRIKKELVNARFNGNPEKGGKRLKPENLLEFYKSNKDFIIVDTRNYYESKVGHFKNAILPNIKYFREWPKIVEQLEKFKNKTIITYCTGGIRCEKATAYMLDKGFTDVYQLDGGIISFIQKFPDTIWQGGMFVFDDRKLVEPNIKEELKYAAKCELCQTPTNQYINCHNLDCDKIFVCCDNCKTKYNYCCSEECNNSPRKRSKIYD
ncbi:MAG: rhodanese-related sulfurtransferase [Ignavibacterium sp.]